MASARTEPEQARNALLALAARSLSGMLALVGVAVLLAWVLGLPGIMGSHYTGLRGAMGLALLALAGLTGLLHRRVGARIATTTALVGALGALAAIAYVSGLGVNTVALAAGALLVTTAGGVAGNRAALLLTLLYLGVVGLMAGLEARGLLPQGVPQPALVDRLIVHSLIACSALIAALLLNRILGAALQRAMAEEQRLARLVRAAHNWDWEADEQFRFTHISEQFEALTGHSRDEFMRLGQPGGPEIVEDADYPALQDDIRARRAYRDHINCFRALDGRLVWALSSGEPVFDEDGRHTGWRGVSHNVTAERLAQQRHRRTADMLDRLMRASPDAICVARLEDGRIVYANAGFQQLVGRDEAELLQRSAFELGLWNELGDARRLRAALAGVGIVRDYRSALQLSDGVWRDVLLSAASFDWDGEPVAVTLVRDITEMELARIEGDAILEHAGVGIGLTRDGRFERVNRRWREIFGGTEPRLADAGDTLPSAQDIASAAQAFERDVLCADGRRITVQFNARGLPATLAASLAQGRRIGEATLWVAEDVTLRRRQERELQAAKQQAEAASHAKSAFLATMSHEIRTPLNGVLGLARLLRQTGTDDPRLPQYLDHLVGAAESLNEIVSNVLDLSKIEAGHLQLERTEFDLHALAHAGFEGCAALGRERGLDMRLEIAPELPRQVLGDPLRVRQILANFLVNALKFTERGHILLQLAPAGPGRVRLAVEDSGIGVPLALQDRLFQPFAQADDSTTRRFGGTGLGLAICRELAMRMNGSVGLHSDGHSGSVFWAEIALPAARQVAAAPVAAPPPPRYPLAGQRLLVAEDNAVNRLIITALLQRLGAEVLEAEDGEQAVQLARAQAQRLDGVLMDLHMPIVDGLRATQLLRADPATAALPIHAFTAAVLDQERQAALDAGMNGFISKPVAEAEVIRVLGRQPG